MDINDLNAGSSISNIRKSICHRHTTSFSGRVIRPDAYNFLRITYVENQKPAFTNGNVGERPDHLQAKCITGPKSRPVASEGDVDRLRT